MTTTPVPGADKATDELLPCPFCGNEQPELEDCRLQWCVLCKCSATVLGERSPERDGTESDDYWRSIRKTAITAWNRRASLAAVPASDPVGQCLDGDRTTVLWYNGKPPSGTPLYTHPAPVSGMPNLVKLRRYDPAAWGTEAEDCGAIAWMEEDCEGQYVEFEDIKALLPSLQAPNATIETDDPYLRVFGISSVAAPLPADPAPTEQAAESIASNHDAMIILTQDFTAEQKIKAVDAHVRRQVAAALAARQAPTEAPKELTPSDMPVLPKHLLNIIGDYGLARTDGLSELQRLHLWETLIAAIKNYAWAARQAPDSRDAERLDWLEKNCTGASDSERYLPFRIYWGNKGATKGLRFVLDAAIAKEKTQ